MSRIKAVVFLGPTLPVAKAREIIGDAVYLPPARQGDLLSAAVNYEPQAIGLIDGVFLQDMSVWHKEILHAIERGVHVFGSSSMGALRAAELAAFGMCGIGEVYRLYASGELIDDDEVALAHESAETGFRKLSEPLINLRFTLQAARDQGLLSDAHREQLIAIAKRLYFGDRVIPVILAQALDAGMPADLIERIEAFIQRNYVDIKAHDAVALLHAIAALPADATKATPVMATQRTPGFETMYNRDRVVPVAGVELPLAAIGNYTALHDPDYNWTHFNALNRYMTVVLAKLVHVEAAAEEVEQEVQRLRNRLELEDDECFAQWLSDTHLSAEEFRVLMVEQALCRRMHRWFMYARWTQRSTSIHLDHLRLEGSYREWAIRAAAQERLLQRSLGAGIDELASWQQPTDKLVADHLEWTDARMDTDLLTWAEDAGFHSKRDLKHELLRARSARLVFLELLATQAEDAAETAGVGGEANDDDAADNCSAGTGRENNSP